MVKERYDPRDIESPVFVLLKYKLFCKSLLLYNNSWSVIFNGSLVRFKKL